MDKENTTPTLENEAAQPYQTTRRTFLKGTTLALPAVITLHSGAALANLSISNCVTQRQGVMPLPCVPATDPNFLRMSVPVYRRLKSKNQLDPSSPAAVYFEGKDMIGGVLTRVIRNISDGQIVSNGNLLLVNDSISNPNGFVAAPPEANQFAIIYYSTSSGSSGNIISVGSATNPRMGTATTVSAMGTCLTSLMQMP